MWNRNFIITGIPRSGTSLFSVLVNDFDNAVCFNEIWYDVIRLPGFYFNAREMILAGKPVPNRYDNSGNLTTNTMGDGEGIREAVIKKPFDESIVIGSKVNAPYLNELEAILYNRIKAIVIVRHPWYTIGSYQTPATQTLNIANPLTDPRYKHLDYATDDPIQCQAELWELFAKKIWMLRNHLTIIRYEDLTERTYETMERFAGLFDLKMPDRFSREIKNMNDPARYPKMDQVKEAAKKYIVTARYFGYEV